MTKYNAAITVHKSGIIAGVGAVGVIVEIVVNRLLPDWFPPGSITAAITTIWTAVANWKKNK